MISVDASKHQSSSIILNRYLIELNFAFRRMNNKAKSKFINSIFNRRSVVFSENSDCSRETLKLSAKPVANFYRRHFPEPFSREFFKNQGAFVGLLDPVKIRRAIGTRQKFARLRFRDAAGIRINNVGFRRVSEQHLPAISARRKNDETVFAPGDGDDR